MMRDLNDGTRLEGSSVQLDYLQESVLFELEAWRGMVMHVGCWMFEIRYRLCAWQGNGVEEVVLYEGLYPPYFYLRCCVLLSETPSHQAFFLQSLWGGGGGGGLGGYSIESSFVAPHFGRERWGCSGKGGLKCRKLVYGRDMRFAFGLCTTEYWRYYCRSRNANGGDRFRSTG